MTHYPFQVSTRVYLRFDTEAQGTVTKVDVNGFTVSWDSHGRPKGRARLRNPYKWNQASIFGVGKPLVKRGE